MMRRKLIVKTIEKRGVLGIGLKYDDETNW